MLCSLIVKIKKWLYDWSFRYELVRLYGSFQVDRRVHTANWKISDPNKFIWCHWCVILINIYSIDRQNDKYNKDYALESGTGLGGEGWRKKNSVDYNFFCTHYILNKYFQPKETIKKHPPSVLCVILLSTSWSKKDLLSFNSLSGCLITEEGFTSLLSSVNSNPSCLRELDLTYNHPSETLLKQLFFRPEDMLRYGETYCNNKRCLRSENRKIFSVIMLACLIWTFAHKTDSKQALPTPDLFLIIPSQDHKMVYTIKIE